MPLTGFLDKNVCYSTSSEAVNSHFSTISPVINISGTSTITTEYLQISGVWYLRNSTTTILGTTTTTTYVAQPPVFPSCDPMLGFTDGISFSMIVVGLIFTSICTGIIRKAL